MALEKNKFITFEKFPTAAVQYKQITAIWRWKKNHNFYLYETFR